MASEYAVKSGETISDVVINATGTLVNLDQVLEDNAFDTWTPDLTPGQLIFISDACQIDSNALRQLQTYPICNMSITDIYDQIEGIFEQLNGTWILSTGFWNVHAVWTATGLWKFPQ
jgi:hypothetical protein